MFLVNSRPGHFSAAPASLRRKADHRQELPFSRSYGDSLPSSLTIVRSLALVFSTRPPVLVSGTGTRVTRLEVFPGSMGLATCPVTGFGPTLRLLWGPDFPGPRPTARPAVYQRRGWPTLLRHSIARTPRPWCRNINLLSIAYSFRSQLRPRLTLGRSALPRNPWAFGGWDSHPSLVTHASILSPDASTAGSRRRFCRDRMLPYHSPQVKTCCKSAASVNGSRPDEFSAQCH